jgi:hypothetical protein
VIVVVFPAYVHTGYRLVLSVRSGAYPCLCSCRRRKSLMHRWTRLPLYADGNAETRTNDSRLNPLRYVEIEKMIDFHRISNSNQQQHGKRTKTHTINTIAAIRTSEFDDDVECEPTRFSCDQIQQVALGKHDKCCAAMNVSLIRLFSLLSRRT